MVGIATMGLFSQVPGTTSDFAKTNGGLYKEEYGEKMVIDMQKKKYPKLTIVKTKDINLKTKPKLDIVLL